MSTKPEYLGAPEAFFFGHPSTSGDTPATLKATSAVPCMLRVTAQDGSVTTFGSTSRLLDALSASGTRPYFKFKPFSMVPGVSIHFQPGKDNNHVVEDAQHSLHQYTEILITGEHLAKNPAFGGRQIPDVGFSKPTLRTQDTALLHVGQRDAANDRARQMSKPGQSICYVDLHIASGSQPLLTGVLPQESRNSVYTQRTDSVHQAKRIEVVLESSNNVEQMALWIQGLFALRHTANYAPNDVPRDEAEDFFFFATQPSWAYDFHEDEATGDRSFSLAPCRAYNLLEEQTTVPFPPWLIGQRLSTDSDDTTDAGAHLTVDQVQPYMMQRMPVLPTRRIFEGIVFLALLRDAEAADATLTALYNANVKHKCLFEQLHGTCYFRVGVSIVGQQHLAPLPGTRVIVRRSDDVYDGIVSSAETEHDFVVFATTQSKTAFSSNGFETCNVVVSGTRRLVGSQARAIQQSIVRLTPPRVGYFDLRTLLWGTRKPISPSRNLVKESAAQSCSLVDDVRSGLDRWQQRAFDGALLAVKNDCQLIDGPGGTGKSETLIAIVLVAIMIGKAVRVVMPSNTVIEQFLERLVLKARELGVQGFVEPVRLYTSALERSASGRDKSDREAHAQDVAFIAEMMVEEEREFLTERSIDLNYALSSRVLAWARSTCGNSQESPSDQVLASRFLHLRNAILVSCKRDALSKLDKSLFRGFEDTIKGKVLSKANVLLHTPAKAGSADITAFQADMLVFDEAGAANIGHLCQAIGVNDQLEVVVLAGDTNQLPPTDIAGSLTRSEFSSFLHRPLLDVAATALNRRPDCLNSQYRSHPQLREILTPLVYGRTFDDVYKCRDATLVAGVLDFMHHGPYRAAFQLTVSREIIVDVNAIDVKPSITSSRFNPGSMGAMALLLRELCAWEPNPERVWNIDGRDVRPRRVRFADVGLMSTHKLHISYLKRMLEKMAENQAFADAIESLKMATVDGYQGGERSIMMVDTVVARENPTAYTFVANEKRLNTAMGRARDFSFVFLNVDMAKRAMAKTRTKAGGLKKNATFFRYVEEATTRRPIVKWSVGTTTRTLLTRSGPAASGQQRTNIAYSDDSHPYRADYP